MHRLHDALEHLVAHRIRHHRRRRVGTHSPGVRTGVSLTHPLVVLAGWQCHPAGFIEQHEHARFLTREELFEQHEGVRVDG